jgi:hypothetical protein
MTTKIEKGTALKTGLIDIADIPPNILKAVKLKNIFIPFVYLSDSFIKRGQGVNVVLNNKSYQRHQLHQRSPRLRAMWRTRSRLPPLLDLTLHGKSSLL